MKVNSDFTKILTKEHEGKWVALTRDCYKVVDFGDDFAALAERIDQKKKDVVYHKVLPTDMEFSFPS